MVTFRVLFMQAHRKAFYDSGNELQVLIVMGNGNVDSYPNGEMNGQVTPYPQPLLDQGSQ